MKPISIWNYLQECIDLCKTNNHIISNIFIIILVIFIVHICIKYTNNGMIIEGMESSVGKIGLDEALESDRQSADVFNNIVETFRDGVETHFINEIENMTLKTDDASGDTNKRSIEKFINTLKKYTYIKNRLIRDVLEKRSIPLDKNIELDEKSVREKFKMKQDNKVKILEKLNSLKTELTTEQTSIMTNKYGINENNTNSADVDLSISNRRYSVNLKLNSIIVELNEIINDLSKTENSEENNTSVSGGNYNISPNTPLS